MVRSPEGFDKVFIAGSWIEFRGTHVAHVFELVHPIGDIQFIEPPRTGIQESQSFVSLLMEAARQGDAIFVRLKSKTPTSKFQGKPLGRIEEVNIQLSN